MNIFSDEEIRRECLIDGHCIPYNVCSRLSLDEAKAYYGDQFEHIGDSQVMYINGIRDESKSLYHFFRLK